MAGHVASAQQMESAVSIYHPSVLSSIPGPGQQGAWVMEGPCVGCEGPKSHLSLATNSLPVSSPF